jgi:hypothetical protein
MSIKAYEIRMHAKAINKQAHQKKDKMQSLVLTTVIKPDRARRVDPAPGG